MTISFFNSVSKIKNKNVIIQSDSRVESVSLFSSALVNDPKPTGILITVN